MLACFVRLLALRHSLFGVILTGFVFALVVLLRRRLMRLRRLLVLLCCGAVGVACWMLGHSFLREYADQTYHDAQPA